MKAPARKTSWASPLIKQIKQAVREAQPAARGFRGKPKPQAIASLSETLAQLAPDRRALFESEEFKKTASEILAHTGAAEAIARLCNTLLFRVQHRTLEKTLLAPKVVPPLRDLGKAFARAVERLEAGVSEFRRKGRRTEERELREVLRDIWALKIKAERIEELHALRAVNGVPGLEADSIRVKTGVPLESAVPATAAREVWKAMPETLRSDHKLMVALMQRAGFNIDRAAFKSAVQAWTNRTS